MDTGEIRERQRARRSRRFQNKHDLIDVPVPDGEVLSSAGVDTPVRRIQPGGLPLNDSYDRTQFNPHIPYLPPQKLKYYPWIGSGPPANPGPPKFDLFRSKTLKSLVPEGTVIYGDAFLWVEPEDPEENPNHNNQPVYGSAVSGTELLLETYYPFEETSSLFTQAIGPGAQYLGATCWATDANVTCIFGFYSPFPYPGKSNADTRVTYQAIPVGGGCYALQERRIGTETSSDTAFKKIAQAFVSTVNDPDGRSYDTPYFTWGLSASSSGSSAYTNHNEEITPIVCGRDLAIYTAREQGTYTRNGSATGSTEPKSNPDLHVEIEGSGPTGPIPLGVYTNSTLLGLFTLDGPGGYESASYGNRHIETPIFTFTQTVVYGPSTFSTMEDKVNSPLRHYLVASDGSQYSDPYELTAVTPRAYGVSLESGTLDLDEEITLKITSGGESGDAFALSKETHSTRAAGQWIKAVDVPGGVSASEIYNAFPASVSRQDEPGTSFPSFWGGNLSGGGLSNVLFDPFEVWDRTAGVYFSEGQAVEAPGVGNWDIALETVPAISQDNYAYRGNPIFDLSNFDSSNWILVDQATSKRYRLEFIASAFPFVSGPQNSVTPIPIQTRNLMNHDIDFLVLEEMAITWDAVAGDIADLGPDQLVLYPEQSTIALKPEFTQLYGNDAEFIFTDNSGDGSGGPAE